MKINSLDDISALVTNQISESKEIDYKELLNLSSSEEKIKFLQNITSFANAVGCNLIYGIKEERGIPLEIVGIEIIDNDKLKLQIENILRDLIDPRINNIKFNFIPISESKQVLVINIPNSWNKPHVVKVNKYWSFHSRNSVGKYPLDLSEIRNLFISASMTLENIKNFKLKRISDIVSNQTPIPISNDLSGKLVIHIIPIDSFNLSLNYEIHDFRSNKILKPLVYDELHIIPNFDGLLFYSPSSENPKSLISYLQLYRNGIIETVDADSLNCGINGDYVIDLNEIESRIYELISCAFIAYTKLGISSSFFISISFLSVKNRKVKVDNNNYNRRISLPLNKEDYFLPEFLVELNDKDLEERLSEIFLPMWNAFGFENKII